MNGHRISICDLYRWPRQLLVHQGDQCLVAQVRHFHLAHLHTCMFQQIIKRANVIFIVFPEFSTHSDECYVELKPWMLIMLTIKVCSTTEAMAAGGIMAWRKKTAAMVIAVDASGKLQHFIVCKFIWFVRSAVYFFAVLHTCLYIVLHGRYKWSISGCVWQTTKIIINVYRDFIIVCSVDEDPVTLPNEDFFFLLYFSMQTS